ncbi:hypothetical protein IW261DRAFT_1428838 [Armillaria novae-zelandiae]|uniref:Uncharacterized protein n=1 Tax=Armillaria novae-zelandiae TaxID=153914 RepID=A0AA39TND1_9AGAR|nr:hypothetical protein IW261DRAFT_1428838 [Armillaria novae-zelandiae]
MHRCRCHHSAVVIYCNYFVVIVTAAAATVVVVTTIVVVIVIVVVTTSTTTVVIVVVVCINAAVVVIATATIVIMGLLLIVEHASKGRYADRKDVIVVDIPSVSVGGDGGSRRRDHKYHKSVAVFDLFPSSLLPSPFEVSGAPIVTSISMQMRIQQDAVDSQFDLGQNQAASMDHGATNTPMLLFGNQAQSSTESQNPSSALVTDATNQILDLVNSYNPKFVIEYHPRALLDPRILTREEYFQLTAVEMTHSFIDDCPWHPFASKNDFELAEHILRTRLNREGQDSLFKVLKTQAGDHQSAYTINNESDFKEAWSKAENLLTKLDEKTNERMQIFNEPWTGDLLWEVQSSLPPGGKPLAYILYADKTRLSSFGTAKGYPVMARIANLPDAICNGKGWGGGTVVGWLPIVEDDPKHKGKPAWINFNCHILVKLSSFIHSFLFFLPFMKNNEHPLWTTKEMQDLYNLVEEEGEEVLDESSLQPVENVFWSIARSDPYKAVSWDRLHAYHLEHVERISGPQKRAAKVAIDELIRLMNFSIANFPRWRNLKHFDNVTTFDFGDGVKFEHMSKQLLFPVHSVLRKEVHHDAYLLLKVIRSYVELDMYASMDVHTEKSIEEGRHLMNVFDAKLKAYSRATDDKQFKNPTSWKIPKVHTQQHFFNDIIAKGATKNYNTKVNESMHGPLKKAHQIQTNFKDVAEQILMTDHRYNIIMQIRQQIDHQKKHQEEENDDLSEDKNHIRQNQRIGTLDSKAMLHSLQATPKDPCTVRTSPE